MTETKRYTTLKAWADEARKRNGMLDHVLSCTISAMCDGAEGGDGSALLGVLPIEVAESGTFAFDRVVGDVTEEFVLMDDFCGFDVDIPAELIWDSDARASAEMRGVGENSRLLEAAILGGSTGRFPGLAESCIHESLDEDPFDQIERMAYRVFSPDILLTTKQAQSRIPDLLGLYWVELSSKSAEVLGVGDDGYVIMSTGPCGVGLFSRRAPERRDLGVLEHEPVYRTRIDWMAGLVVWRREAAIIVRKAR